MTFLIIDNYDSFVHNLARYVTLSGVDIIIKRNDAVTIDNIKTLTPTAIILSPGPCTPQQAGVSIDIVKTFGTTIPILGVCLGHQAIAEAYGGKTVRHAPVHGMASSVTHNNSALFHDIPSPFQAGRYHSLLADIANAPDLIATAHTDNGTVMALEHATHPVYGVQFHPESLLTEHGLAIIENFVTIAHDFHSA